MQLIHLSSLCWKSLSVVPGKAGRVLIPYMLTGFPLTNSSHCGSGKNSFSGSLAAVFGVIKSTRSGVFPHLWMNVKIEAEGTGAEWRQRGQGQDHQAQPPCSHVSLAGGPPPK